MRNQPVSLAVAALLVLAAAPGCATHYKVTDPSTDKVYYTKDLDRERSGAVTLTDAATGSRVTLQNSEVKEIGKREFKAQRPKN